MCSSLGASLKCIASGRKILIGLILVGAAVQFVTFYREAQRAAEKAKEWELAVELVKKRLQTIHSECGGNSDTAAANTGGGDTCWQVMDLVSVRGRRPNEPREDGDEVNRLIGERFLAGSASRDSFFFSKVDLVVPRPLTSRPTKDWDVNTARLSLLYLHAAILIPLTTGHLRLDDGDGDDDSPLETVFVGIGGGAFSAYLQTRNHNWQILSIELDPRVVRLARQFFGLRDEENARETVRVGDGLAWIEETAAKGKQVDVVYMDANGEHAKDGFVSPLAALIDEDSDLVAKLASVIRPNGLYFSNVLTIGAANETAQRQQRILRRYERHFAHCLIVDYKQKGFVSRHFDEEECVCAQQLGCSHSFALDVKSASGRRADFLATAKSWYRRLGFDSSLESVLRIVTTA